MNELVFSHPDSWKITEPRGESFAKPHSVNKKNKKNDLKLKLKINFQLSMPQWQVYLIQEELDTPERDTEFNSVFKGQLLLIQTLLVYHLNQSCDSSTTDIFTYSGALVDALLFPFIATLRAIYFLSTWERPDMNRLSLFTFFMTYLLFRWILGLKFLHVWPILLWGMVFLIGYVQKQIYFGVKVSLWDDLKPNVSLLKTDYDSSSDSETTDIERVPPKSKLDTLRIPKPEENKLRTEFYKYQQEALQKINVIKQRVER